VTVESEPGSQLSVYFADLADPRVDRTKLHHLLDIIAIALLGVICGADSWTEIEAFGQAKEAWLRGFLALPHGIPSHDTFGRIFAALNPAQFERSFTRWVAALEERTDGRVIALDGKTLRGSHDRAAGRPPLHLVSAWASANRLVLAQVAVDSKSNEITALPVLLEALDVRQSVVTIDAMGCQTVLAAGIVRQGGDYVFALKGNQGDLHQGVHDAFALAAADGFAEIAHDWVETVEQGHGRIETRRVTTISEPSWLAHLNPAAAWVGLRSIVQVYSRRDLQGRVTEEYRYYISSLAGDAARIGAAVREHWGIENSEHWVLDMAFREDQSRVRRAAHNLAVLRRLALNLLRQDRSTKIGVKAKRLKAGWDDAYLLQVLFQ
jgi:predicted transposase YbfD/YdcC